MIMCICGPVGYKETGSLLPLGKVRGSEETPVLSRDVKREQ